MLTNVDIENIGVLKSEILFARSKFPGNNHLLAALVEEVGELSKALLEGKEGWRKEGIQVACVAMRIAAEGDGDYRFTQLRKEAKR